MLHIFLFLNKIFFSVFLQGPSRQFLPISSKNQLILLKHFSMHSTNATTFFRMIWCLQTKQCFYQEFSTVKSTYHAGFGWKRRKKIAGTLTKKWNTFGLGREYRMGQSHIFNNADNYWPYIYATALNTDGLILCQLISSYCILSYASLR